MISITRTGAPVDGIRRSDRPTGALRIVRRTQTGISGLSKGSARPARATTAPSL